MRKKAHRWKPLHSCENTCLNRSKLKPVGGIRTADFAKQLIDAGATRLGCSASIAIVKGETGNASY